MSPAEQDVRSEIRWRKQPLFVAALVVVGGVHLAPSGPLSAATAQPTSGERSVAASVETDAVSHAFDAADDAAIWVHPDDPSRSTIIGTDKRGGFVIYDLEGRMLHYLAVGRMNNVDVRYNFSLGGELIDIVVASDRSRNAIAAYRVTPQDRSLVEITQETLPLGIQAYGMCLYQSPLTGRLYAFAVGRRGRIEQWELRDNGHSLVQGTLVRELPLSSRGEGCVADDELGHLYVGEEKVGIWKFTAEPGTPTAGVLLDSTRRPGHLTSDVEGLALYHAAGGAGYLLASSQGSGQFMVYDRGGDNSFVTSFRIATGAVDAVTDTDGIDVLGFNLGPGFPNGAFVAQDGRNSSDGRGDHRRTGPNQNFKLVPWEAIAGANPDRPLIIDNTLDPRRF